MNILVIGLGSMGKRRIRLLKQLDERNIIMGVDLQRKRQEEVEKLYHIPVFSSMEEAKKEQKVDCAFVCTSPLTHAGIIRECLKNQWNVFTELNLVSDGYEENIKLAKEKGCVLFLSSTFYYREEIQYIYHYVKEKKRLNYIYHIGQYLPDWHPWENYRDFFAGEKRTNGCREIMAVELPWLTGVFGDVKRCQVMADKMSELEIAYHDNYLIELEHANGNKGVLVVDVVCPVAVRRLEVYGENVYLRWNGTPTGIQCLDDSGELKAVELYEKTEHAEGYRSFITENAYYNEIQEFMNVLAGRKKQRYGFEKDLEVLNLINRIEGNYA